MYLFLCQAATASPMPTRYFGKYTGIDPYVSMMRPAPMNMIIDDKGLTLSAPQHYARGLWRFFYANDRLLKKNLSADRISNLTHFCRELSEPRAMDRGALVLCFKRALIGPQPDVWLYSTNDLKHPLALFYRGAIPEKAQTEALVLDSPGRTSDSERTVDRFPYGLVGPPLDLAAARPMFVRGANASDAEKIAFFRQLSVRLWLLGGPDRSEALQMIRYAIENGSLVVRVKALEVFFPPQGRIVQALPIVLSLLQPHQHAPSSEGADMAAEDYVFLLRKAIDAAGLLAERARLSVHARTRLVRAFGTGNLNHLYLLTGGHLNAEFRADVEALLPEIDVRNSWNLNDRLKILSALIALSDNPAVDPVTQGLAKRAYHLHWNRSVADACQKDLAESENAADKANGQNEDPRDED